MRHSMSLLGRLRPGSGVIGLPPATTIDGTSSPAGRLHIVWPGFGTCFFWQAGVMSRLSERVHPASLPSIGSSGGGLVALLGACEVPPAAAVATAFRLAAAAGVYERRLGLLGIWRDIVHRWLDELLPADAATRCGNVSLVVTEVPTMQPLKLCSWHHRSDLISAALASAHIPLLLDGRLTTPCRGRQVLDGNLHYAWLGRKESMLPADAPSLVFDPRDDPRLQQTLRGFGACVRRMDDTRALELVELGRQHFDDLAARGELDWQGLRTATAPQ